jgi:hypothetical protein
MDFNNYANLLGQLDKQEIEVELNNFYTFNSGLLQFFKAIDNQFQMLLNTTTLNSKSIETVLAQTNIILPDLNNLKFAVSMLDEEEISEFYQKDISKTLKYIKDVMVISEVQHIKQNFDKLLSDNESKFKQEQATKEHLIKEEIENQKRIELEKQESKRLEEEARKREEQEKIRIENERIERERLEKIKVEAETRERLRFEEEKRKREEQEKIRIENERLEKDRIEKKRLEQLKKKEDEQKLRLEKERTEKEQSERNRKEAERKEKENIQNEINIRKKLLSTFNIVESEVYLEGQTYKTLIINNKEWIICDLLGNVWKSVREFKDIVIPNGWQLASENDWIEVYNYKNIIFDPNIFNVKKNTIYWTSTVKTDKEDPLLWRKFVSVAAFVLEGEKKIYDSHTLVHLTQNGGIESFLINKEGRYWGDEVNAYYRLLRKVS